MIRILGKQLSGTNANSCEGLIMKLFVKNIFDFLVLGIVFMTLSGCKGTLFSLDKDLKKDYSPGNELKYDPNMITEKRAIEIANKKMIELGYKIELMDVVATIHDKPWNYCLLKGNDSEYQVRRKEKLAQKIYWEIYFSKKKEAGVIHLGGDACIYVDVISGEILTYYLGK